MIRFRAWHKESKKMHDISGIDFANEFAWLLHNEMFTRIYASKCELHEIHLMQYTGFKDKEGNEIYEGDILAYDFTGGVECYVLERNPDDNQIHARYLYMSGYNTEYLGEVPLASSLIIGNQWENPDLLEAKDE